MAMENKPNAPLIVAIGIVSGLMLLVIMVGTEAWFKYEEKQELAVKWENSRNVQLDAMRAEQTAHIETSTWCDASKTAVTIPVTDAMRVLIASSGKLPSTQPATQPAH